MSVGTHLILLIKAAIEDLKIRVDGCRPDTGQTRRRATSRFSRLELLKTDSAESNTALCLDSCLFLFFVTLSVSCHRHFEVSSFSSTTPFQSQELQ